MLVFMVVKGLHIYLFSSVTDRPNAITQNRSNSPATRMGFDAFIHSVALIIPILC